MGTAAARAGVGFFSEGLYKKDDYCYTYIVWLALASTTPALVYGRCCVSNPRGRYHPLRSVPAPWGRERERKKRALGKATSGCFSVRRWRQDAGTWQNGDYFPISRCKKGVRAGRKCRCRRVRVINWALCVTRLMGANAICSLIRERRVCA